MELPNLNFLEWEEKCGDRQHGTQKRASVKNVARYYEDYVELQGLRPHFRDSAEVTSVRRLDGCKGILKDNQKDQGLWLVSGHIRTPEGLEDFQYVTPNVVLAIGGFDLPNRLNVPGENLPFVINSLKAMEQLISSRQLTANSDPLLIVGAGLSAADAIIAAHFHGIPIIHAFRRKADDPSLIFRQLPSNMYPEYHKVIHTRTFVGYSILIVV